MAAELQHRVLGGTPSPQPDVAIDITFLTLFTVCGIFNLQIFWRNKKQQRLFAFSAAVAGRYSTQPQIPGAVADDCTGFCSLRIVTTSLRIAWAYDPSNVQLAMGARITTYTAAVILIVSNIWWSQRILRAQHPTFGWTMAPTLSIPICVGLCVLTIILMIMGTCIQSYVAAARAQYAARCIQQYGDIFFAILAVLPIPVLLTSALAKTHPDLKDLAEDNFGRHCITRKILVCLITATFLSTGALFRATISFAPDTQPDAPNPWYYSRTCFYVFNFALDILVLVLWMCVRIEKMFIVPNGAWGPQSYGGGFIFAGEPGNEKPAMVTHSREHIIHAIKSYDTLSSRSSTIPPPSRSGSWGSARRYMSASPSLPHISSPRLGQRSSWGDDSHTRVDSAWGDDSRTGIRSVDSKENLYLRRPAPCVRCRHCASHEDVSEYTGTMYRNRPVLRFDPRSAQWISRPMSLSGPSVSQYSVRETLRPVSTIDVRMSEDASPGSFLGYAV